MSYPFKPTEKWDVHTHTTLSPDTYEPLARFDRYADFVRVRAHETKPCCAKLVNSRGEVQRVIGHNAYDAKVRRDDCDKYGVTRQVLSPTPMMIPDYVDAADDAADICRILNDDNARLADEFPGRFVAIGALPMRFPDRAIQEMERIKAMGMRGIEVNSNINGMDLDDPDFFPVFEAAEALGMAVFIHPWGGFLMPSEKCLRRRMNAEYNWRPWLFGMGLETALAFDDMHSGGVHARLPNLRVLYAHGGGMFPGLLGRLEHGGYARPDLFTNKPLRSPWDTVKNCSVYTDTLTHNPWALGMLLGIMGSHRIALGSDYPYPLGELDPHDQKHIYPGHMIEHLPGPDTDMRQAWPHFNWLPDENADGPRELPRLSDTEKQNMLSGTARQWLGL